MTRIGTGDLRSPSPIKAGINQKSNPIKAGINQKSNPHTYTADSIQQKNGCRTEKHSILYEPEWFVTNLTGS